MGEFLRVLVWVGVIWFWGVCLDGGFCLWGESLQRVCCVTGVAGGCWSG